MSAIKAKFTKNAKGESEVDYTNFDNPIYGQDGNGKANFEADTASVSTRNSTAMLFGQKGDNTKKKWLIIGGAIILACLVIIIVAAVVASTAKKEKDRRNAMSAESKTSATYSGTMRITDRPYIDAYTDSSSTEYIQLKASFEDSMDKVLQDNSNYVGTEVTAFKPGSVVVLYIVTYHTDVDLTADELTALIDRNVAENGGNFGDMSVDIHSIRISEGKLTTTTSKPTTTTIIPEQPCGHPIIDECKSILTYSTSRRPLDEQNAMKQVLLDIARKTAQCYPDAMFYMCAYIAPHCYSDQDATKFLLPCSQSCQTYTKQCKGVLTEDDKATALDCQALPPYRPDANVCAYQGAPPVISTPAPTYTPDIQPAELCYPMHHSYCQNVNWHTAFLPNYKNHSTINQVYEYLSFLQALTDSGLRCHDMLHTLMCGTLLPKCDENFHRVPPCKSFCEEVVANCSLLLGNLPVNIPLDCSQFHRDTHCTRGGESTVVSPCDRDTEYTCLDQQQCISQDGRCNGFVNCIDGSDEHGCSATGMTCLDGEFKCKNTGLCIQGDWRCDNYNDCGDGSDEDGCECGEEKFWCPSQDGTPRCIDDHQQCDGYFNCFNHQDEMNCDNFTCIDDQFQCANGNCRPARFICDGDDDCGDMSDEVNCLLNEQCADGEFKCVNGSRTWGLTLTSCIPEAWRCDAERDCDDTSDEKGCESFCNPNPCSHQGNCTASPSGFRCICPPGTGGSNCQIVENLPDVSCDTPITIEACIGPLAPYHDKTISTTFSQSTLSAAVTQAIPKLTECYEHAAEFLCSFAVPECGALAFPKFPCRSMCREFTARCAHKLNETEAISRLVDCNSFADDYTNPDAECFKLGHTTPTIAPALNETLPRCEEVRLPYCSDVGYTRAYFPNYFNQTHQNEAQWLITQIEYAHSSMPVCNPYLKHFGCSIVAPKCSANGTERIPPCKELCEAVEYDCGYWMDHMQWRFPFTCDDFPSQNSSVACIPLPDPEPVEGCYGDQFQCGSGECLHKRLLCDDYVDCDDGSDEDTETCADNPNIFATSTPLPTMSFLEQIMGR